MFSLFLTLFSSAAALVAVLVLKQRARHHPPMVRVIGAANLSAREKVVVVAWQRCHYLLSVTQGQVQLLDKSPQPAEQPTLTQITTRESA